MTEAQPNPMRQAFAAALKAAMAARGMSASEVARLVWGTIKDKRGYDVARNRDRIGHYLSGDSFPTAANITKLAAALGVPAATLVPPIIPPNAPPWGPPAWGPPEGGGWGAALQWIEDHPWMVAGLDEERRRYLPFALAALWQAGKDAGS